MDKTTEVKTAELIGPALDWAVALACEIVIDDSLGKELRINVCPGLQSPWMPSFNWHQCGPLIARYRVSIIYSDEACNPCAWTDSTAAWHAETPIIAACRAIVANKLGDTVRVPAELVKS
jgi:hypothetical protein